MTPARYCYVCSEAAALAEAGEVLERIAERLQRTPDSLLTHLRYRHGRADLAARIPRMADVKPTTFR